MLSVPTHCNQVKSTQATPLKTFPTARIVQGKKVKISNNKKLCVLKKNTKKGTSK
jgi:hypothetical protein